MRSIVVLFLLLSLNLSSRTFKVFAPGAFQDFLPNLQDAFNKVNKGDTVILQGGRLIAGAGTAVCNKPITLLCEDYTKGIIRTAIFRSYLIDDSQLSLPIIKFNINSTAKSNILIAGISFSGKILNVDYTQSLAPDCGLEMVNAYGFHITDCIFKNFGNAGLLIRHDDSLVSGLVDFCKFEHNAKGEDALGLGYGVAVYGANKKWIANPNFGSSNFIFVENCTFDYHRHSIAGGGCALYVFRYNEVYNNVAGNTAHAIDAHEARLYGSENYYATRAIEVYNNKIINYTFKDGTTNCPNGTLIVAGKSPGWLVECAIRTRGGEAVIHDNYIEGYRFGVGLIDGLGATYPSKFQQGYLSAAKYGANHTGIDGDKANGDVFIWSDNYSSYAPTNSQCVYFYNYSLANLVKDRDFHLFAKPNYKTYQFPHPLAN